MKCPGCESAVPSGARSCPWCGKVFVELQPEVASGAAQCATHPTRPGQPCSRCGTFYCGECLVGGTPEAPRCRACEEREGDLPWDRRDELGTWRAWWQTSIKVISTPFETFRKAKPDAPLGSSLLFSLLSSVAGVGTTMLLYTLFAGVMFVGVGKALEEKHSTGDLPAGAMAGIGIGVILFYVVVLLGGQAVWMLAVSGIEVLILRMLGEKGASYSVTVRAHALSMGPYLVGLIPVCGLYVYPLWSLVLRIFAVQHLQRTTGGRAAGAVLIPIGAMIALCGIGYLMVFAMMFAAMGAAK